MSSWGHWGLHTAADEDYRMRHRPPAPEDGAAMHDPSNVFPDIDTHPEWYSSAPGRGNPSWGPEERNYFRQQQQTDRESHAAIRAARGNPDAPVTIYRALPTSAQHPDGSFPMNTGDWVTPSLAYARIHGDSNIGEPYSIIKHTAPARSLYSEGNSIHEWGYAGAPARVHTASTNSIHYVGGLHTAAEHPTDEWGNRAYPQDKYGNPDYGDDCDLEEYMYGQCASYARAHNREYPHLRVGIDWEKVTKGHPYWHELMNDWEDLDGDDPDNADHVIWRPQHYFTHDDHWSYDAAGARPLSAPRRWQKTTLDHDEDALWEYGDLESGHEPDSDYVRKNPPRTSPPRTASTNGWGLHTAAEDKYSLPAVWEDYQDWNGPVELGLTDPKKTIQHWGSVQDYLRDRHGIDPYTAKGYKHPASLAMAKLHALAQSKGWMDGLFSAKEMVPDDLLHGAALGLLKIRHNQYTNQIEPDVPDDHTTASTNGIRYAQVVEADVADDLHRLAMPWPDWAPKVQGGCQGCDGTGDYGEYYIDHPDGSGKQPGDIMPGLNGRSVLHFYHDTGRDGQPELYVSGLHTDSNHRQDGVAESLMRHLHRSHPGTRINPGFMTEDGQAFHDRMLSKEPEARGTLTPRFAAVLPHCPRHGGEWGDDEMCPACCDSGGDPRPVPEGMDEPPTVTRHPSGLTIARQGPFWTAHHGDTPVGFLHAPQDDPDLPRYIARIETSPDHRGRGVARALWETAGRPLHTPQSETNEGGAWARAVGAGMWDYTKHGWPKHQASRTALTPRFAASVGEGLLSRLHGEFHDWWDQNKDDLFFPEANNNGQGPLGYWPNIESFLADRYPAAHKGHNMGKEETAPLLDGGGKGFHRVRNTDPYETGPEAVGTHGYDPKEVAAGMLLLHNRSHPNRSDLEEGDQDRLSEIARIRSQQQRAYEQRNARVSARSPRVLYRGLKGVIDLPVSGRRMHASRTARAPWNPAGTPLFRGVRVRWSPSDLEHLHEVHASGDRQALAHSILDRIQTGSRAGEWHRPREGWGGLGVFWSGDPGVSDSYSHHGDGHDPDPPGPFENVVLQTDGGHDPAHEWTPYDEGVPHDWDLNEFLNQDRETDLVENAPVNITHVHVNGPAGRLSIPLGRPRRMTARADL